MEIKKELRKEFSHLRAEIKDKVSKDLDITERLLEEEKITEADNILLYASFGSEVDTYLLIDKLIEMGKKVALPKCGAERSMSFHLIGSVADLHEGMYRIPEPDIALPQPVITDKTVCIIPGLAFTEEGGRLGYGGGYYDAFISQYPEMYTIALAYEEIIVDQLPLMKHDLTVDLIVTEERTVLCNG
ncbi:5-formyltetrahydrofolate cyclo-ligase [Ruminococcus sp.]|uniref:5-formyltetrahydrofolate cyclo-ligase n=1 Tax=Ruminococcus sp. TaxID=41978 RepID=UPI0025E8E2AA|nr:5-formyltetrahydrofolate cyclo-ligase [Ruminococcus sp.]